MYLSLAECTANRQQSPIAGMGPTKNTEVVGKQALMNEIALLSKLLESPAVPSTSYHFNYKYSISKPQEAVVAQLSSSSPTIMSRGFVPASSLVPKLAIPANNHGNRSILSQISRYRIDRRDKSIDGTQSPPKAAGTSVADKRPLTPKKYSIIKKYFLKKSPNKPPAVPNPPVEISVMQKEMDKPINTTSNFVIKNNGKTLRRIKRNSLTLSSSNTPIAAHRIANRVLQRSIHTLRRGNEICLFYKRFGRCAHEHSRCSFLHIRDGTDSIRKSTNKKLKGFNPPCIYFSRGICSKVNCQFTHVKTKGSGIGLFKLKRKSVKPTTAVLAKRRKESRYYDREFAADDSCISLVVPRNVRYCVSDSEIPSLSTSSSESDDESVSEVKGQPETEMVSNPTPPVPDPRRQRLLQKVTSLKQRFASINGKNYVTSIPDFLPFKNPTYPPF